jgi:hypothetical protein
MRKRAARVAHGHTPNSPDTLPDMGTQLASTAHRAGGAARFAAVAVRFAAVAVPKTLAVDLALLTSYEDLRPARALSRLKTAPQHDAHPLSFCHTRPGMGTRRSLVLLEAIHDIRRLPRVQDGASSARFVTGSKASAGKRWAPRANTSGTRISRGPVPQHFPCSDASPRPDAAEACGENT